LCQYWDMQFCYALSRITGCFGSIVIRILRSLPESASFILRISPSGEFSIIIRECFLGFGVAIIWIDDISPNLVFAHPGVVKSCARPYLSAMSWYLFWVLNLVFTILSSFPVGQSLAMTATHLGVVVLPLRMSLHISPKSRISREIMCII